ncbi:MAG: xanthine dehydrogenase family protein molybdopterin-binding subunit [Candidatus Caldarchaeum sp.]|nr:xanthine dehydrogenase family protein molybdopterin-binding subunit [Candidatus Caldarchaeum sp.]MDW7978434.1 xanthine dehydrogenase family protein molybdopterin-binding subunit [Candidatus Caldarchaeum sp.]
MDSTQSSRYIGKPFPSLVGPNIVCGSAKYLDDLYEENVLYLGFSRSAHPHAKIKVDVKEAKSLPGVVEALTGEDIVKMMPCYPPFFKDLPGIKYWPAYGLAVDVARYAGEPLAAVLADDRYALADALEAVKVDYAPLPVVSDIESSLDGRVLLYPEWGDNIIFSFTIKAGDVEKAFKESDIVIEERIKVHRHTAAPMEPRGYMAKFEKASGTLTYYASTQQPHTLRTLLSEMLGIPENKIRVIQPYVGGGFGVKTPFYAEEALVAFLAMRVGGAVKWVETRREHFVSTGHARDQVHNIRVGASKDGVVLGLSDRIYADFGAFFPTQGYAQLLVSAKYITGPYAIKNLHVEGYGCATNKTPYAPYRGFGKETACVVYERMMDLVARELGLDRVEVRLKNLIPSDAFPYKTATGAVYDSGDYVGLLTKVRELVDYEKFKEFKRSKREQGRLIGLGIAVAVEPSGASIPNSLAQGYDATTIRIDPSGKVTVLTGVTSSGTGNETAIAQVVAEVLGVNLSDVTVIQGDTAICPYGLGTFSSRASIVGASSAFQAAKEIREKILKIASSMLEAKPEDLDVKEGRIFVKGAEDVGLSISDVAKKVYKDPYLISPPIEPGLEATKYFLTPNVSHVPDEHGNINVYPTYPYTVHSAVVDIDPETGAIKILDYLIASDCGVVLNSAMVNGQLIGGFVQGLGGAVFEELVYNDGILISGSFMDYFIPTALEAPIVKLYHHETPSPFTLLGSKGVGESSTVGTYAALLNAVQDALDGETSVNMFPLKPEYIFSLIKNKAAVEKAL